MSTVIPPHTTQPRQEIKINPSILENIALSGRTPTIGEIRQLFGPAHTLGAPKDAQIAMDSNLEQSGVYDLIQHSWHMGLGLGAGTTSFLGYAFLSTLQQNGLIRAGIETVADEMTRKWVEVKGAQGQDDNKVKSLMQEMERLELQRVFNEAASMIGYFGGCLVYIDIEGATDTELPLVLNSATFTPGTLRGFHVVEPINIYPGRYNASDPMREDYFNPTTWWVLGKEYHRSRCLYFTANKMPILLRPSYNFFGLPMAQLALDYVGHFNETRESTARLLTKFSLTAFKTNMSSILQGGGAQDLDARMAYFTQKQSNDGCFVLDMETEDLMKLDTSLGGVVDIPRQALELLSAIFRIPAVKLLGISPAGFNSTGEGDLRNYYDYIASQQQKVLKSPLIKTLDVLMFNLWGHIDRDLTIDFVHPGNDDPRYVAEVQKMQADTSAVLLDRGVISQEEERTRLASDPNSGYVGIDVDNVPPAPVDTGFGYANEGERF